MAHRQPSAVPGPASLGAVKAAVFDSVFSLQAIKQPVKRKNVTSTTAIEYDELRKQVSRLAKPLLGIEIEGWTWGRAITNDGGEPFRLPLADCAESTAIRLPEAEDVQAEDQKFHHSLFCRHLPHWQAQVGAQRFQILLAQVLNGLISAYIRWAYAGTYRSDVTEHLRFWIHNVFRRFTHWTKVQLSAQVGSNSLTSEYIDEAETWLETALTHLGALRVEELFSVIACDDPTNADVANIVEDLRSFLTNPATRTYLTDHFIATLVDRALQPGAATIDILRLYISIIRAFRRLDPKGVLLDRVAKRVRRYLRERDDTVKVIVSGLLSEPVDASNAPGDVLIEVAEELHRPAMTDDHHAQGELDWDNMDWVPDPVDAAPDYMKSDTADVIGSLTSLFESKEVFVKEIQSLLADRLLLSTGSYEHEVRVLDHLKNRFGDSALQACEVMLRDVLDSSRVDAVIDRDLDTDASKAQAPRMHAKILSRLFWPAMSDQDFTLPSALQDAQKVYEKAFEKVKQSRQISWVPSLGQVEVELELEDRIVKESVLPFQAAVIYAFQDLPDTQATKSVEELASELSMSVALARSACTFWASKRVLANYGHDSFSVLETLPDESDAVMADAGAKQDASAAAAEAAAAQAAKEAEEEERKMKMAIYHQFVSSMLTNQGAMPLPRIAMMLNIVVPGGFPFSNEELKEFLSSMVKEGQLEVGPGGNYKAIA